MKKYIIGLFSLAIITASCVKKIEPIDTYGVSVEFRNSGSKFVTGDVTVNPKDSIYLDFTINSSFEDMSYVEIQRNGVRLDTFRLNNLTDKRTFSLIKGYRLDSVAGAYKFRVLARNNKATFLGDGDKAINVTVNPDFNFWSYRILQVPDSNSKTSNCYYSATNGKLYNYSSGAASSSEIDFGFMWDTTGRSSASTTDDLKHTIYALNAPQPQLVGMGYDISTWTKNATQLKKMPSSINFVTNLTSGGAIQNLIAGNMTSGTTSSVSTISTTAGSNIIGFKTVSGKYGALLVRYVNGDSPSPSTQIEVDVKIQK